MCLSSCASLFSYSAAWWMQFPDRCGVATGKIHEPYCYSVNNQAALIVHSSGNYIFSLIIVASHHACIVYCAVYIYSVAVDALI